MGVGRGRIIFAIATGTNIAFAVFLPTGAAVAEVTTRVLNQLGIGRLANLGVVAVLGVSVIVVDVLARRRIMSERAMSTIEMRVYVWSLIAMALCHALFLIVFALLWLDND